MANDQEDFLDVQLSMAGMTGALFTRKPKPNPRTFFSNPANKDRDFLTRLAFGAAETTLGWIPLAAISLESALVYVCMIFEKIYDTIANNDNTDSFSDILGTTLFIGLTVLAAALSPLLNLIDFIGSEINIKTKQSVAPA